MNPQEKAIYFRFGAEVYRKRFGKKDLSNIWTVNDARQIVNIKEQRSIANRLSNEEHYMDM